MDTGLNQLGLSFVPLIGIHCPPLCLAVLVTLIVDLTQPRVIKTSTEELSRSDCPLGHVSVRNSLDLELMQEDSAHCGWHHSWEGIPGSVRKPAEHEP